MAPKLLLCSCLGLCRDCCRKRRRTRSLIPRRGRGPGGKGHVDEDDGDFSDEEEEEDDVDNKSDSNARYSAFDSPLFRRNSGNVDAGKLNCQMCVLCLVSSLLHASAEVLYYICICRLVQSLLCGCVFFLVLRTNMRVKWRGK